MVAGPNGSGKTTLIRTLRAAPDVTLPDLYINADDLCRERGLDARGAQKLAETLRLQALAERRSLMYETVMSHPSKIAELQAAARAGYTTTVVFVATDDPAVNIARVALRVADGGHDVPKDRIRARHRRSIALAPAALAFAAHAYIYDNSPWGSEATTQLQAVSFGTVLRPTVDRPAPWVGELIEKARARAAELEDLHEAMHDKIELTLPNLYAGVTEGIVSLAGKHYVLQLDRASGKAVLHDRTLLSKAVIQRHTYRIEYAEGVSKVTRQPSERIRAVAPARGT